MNKIINFDNEYELNTYVSSKTFSFLGSGSEGNCYRGFNNEAYKVLLPENVELDEYNPESIITSADIKSESFAFPNTIFTINGKFAGYTSKAVVPNLFSDELLIGKGTIDHIDFDKLIDAYHVIQQDIKVLTGNHIKIFDLPHNIVYDGKRVVGIDTCYYSRNNTITLEENLASLDKAMREMFSTFLKFKDDSAWTGNITDASLLLENIDEMGIEELLQDIESKFKKTNPKKYIKH